MAIVLSGIWLLYTKGYNKFHVNIIGKTNAYKSFVYERVSYAKYVVLYEGKKSSFTNDCKRYTPTLWLMINAGWFINHVSKIKNEFLKNTINE